MGVNGLWQVLQPCARPTNLATLNRKRLAVDASIWIYQFLKAVRDKEGNALRNSHVVGFFRRICKLLWFGIQPVFVFDGGAPALKRLTLQRRRHRRDGRREDATRTASKLLAVQMHRIAEEEAAAAQRRRRAADDGDGGFESRGRDGAAPGEVLPRAEDMVYAEEAYMSRAERLKNRRFHKQDAYHLPDLDGGIEAMGRPEDPRIMSIEELEEYARQFHRGEDINLYDFSNIDFDGDFFKSLPPPDRYNILNAARLRSRLRMGLSKEQLDDMFPDRMAFSRFQIERVRERNHLTQRLMHEIGMSSTDLTIGVNRVAGERDREYILVKNDGAEGGWALGVVSKEKDQGQIHKPIDVDALHVQYQTKNDDDDDWEDDDDFEDVPIEGLNRLPKPKSSNNMPLQDTGGRAGENEDSLFVEIEEGIDVDELFARAARDEGALQADEDEDLSRAIAMSLETQHGVGETSDGADAEAEEREAPRWTQRAVEAARPIATTSGKMVAHIVNNRASAAVPRRRPSADSSSDSDMDIGSALAAARRKKPAASQPPPPKPARAPPIRPNVKNPFDGPLPFEKLNWKNSIFEAKPEKRSERATETEVGMRDSESASDDEAMAGGFEKVGQDNAPRPLPPWMIDNSDIRDAIRQQQVVEKEINAEDMEFAMEEERRYHKYNQDRIIEIESSDDDDESDVEIIEPPVERPAETAPVPASVGADLDVSDKIITAPAQDSSGSTGSAVLDSETPASRLNDVAGDQASAQGADESNATGPAGEDVRASSPEVEFEDVELPVQQSQPVGSGNEAARLQYAQTVSAEKGSSDLPPLAQQQDRAAELAAAANETDEVFADAEFDDFSDVEEAELLAQMAEEVEEHARFASTLNYKPTRENQEAYERELKALRNQQKKDRRDADEVTQVMVAECQALLRLFGIPYITAPMEAEAQCAELVSLGLVDGIVTDDSDIFLFGGTRVYKNMFNGNKFVECYLSADLEKDLSLSREQLIAVAQLLGSDYTDGIPGVGPVTAVEILSEFPGAGGLDEFREWWRDVQSGSRPRDADAASPFRRKFRKSQATKLFLPPGFPNPAVPEAYLRPEVDHSTEAFQWGVPDLDGLRGFLMSTIGWSQERTDEVLVPVIKDMNRREVEGTQSNITRYFTGGVGVGAKEGFAPRQKAKGSKRMAEAVSKLRAKTGPTRTAAAAAAAIEDDDEQVQPQRSSAGRKRKARNKTTVVPDGDHDDHNAADPDDADADFSAGEEGQREPSSEGGGGKGKRARRTAMP